MKPYFNNDERIARLLFHAGKLLGTPWMCNSDVPGRGLSCHNAPRRLNILTGHLTEDFPKINGTPDDANSRSLFEPFIDSRPEYSRIRPADGESILPLLQPGDLVGLWLARDEYGQRVRHDWTNHAGVIINKIQFFHVLAHKCACLDQYEVPPWQQRIVAAWRPVEL
jgi:hypothetical protein